MGKAGRPLIAMRKNTPTLRKLLMVLCALVTTSCASHYRPAEKPPSMSWSEAQFALSRAVMGYGGSHAGTIKEVYVGERALHYATYSAGQPARPGTICAYSDTPRPEVAQESVTENAKITLNKCHTEGSTRSWPYIPFQYNNVDHPNAHQFVDAWYILANSLPPDPAADPTFKAVVTAYRAARMPPELPDGLRAARMSAEQAVKEKRFDRAASAYREGLEIAPWWSAGHFNRGLILGELGILGEATLEMRKYLLLEPEADNARQVQDKIDAWQAKGK
jgi:hypothetical protein